MLEDKALNKNIFKYYGFVFLQLEFLRIPGKLNNMIVCEEEM